MKCLSRLAGLCLLASATHAQTTLIESDFASTLVTRPVPYSVLLPDNFTRAEKPLPLLLMLHGGGGDRSELRRSRAIIEQLWQSGKLARMVVVAPSSTPRGFYMDQKGGPEKWESLLIGPFREHIQKNYNTSKSPKENLLIGISMGGMGSLRIGFKHPEMFGGLAALEPGIEPILHWKDMRPRDRWWRDDGLFETAFGKPVDPVYWEANNPASIAKANPDRLRNSGLKIYLDAGSEDLFHLDEGTEFLHRILYDAKITHEYHYVYGADHIGASLRPRQMEALQFLHGVLNPKPPDPMAAAARRKYAPLKGKFGVD